MSAGAVYVRVVVIDVYFNVDVAWRGVRSVGRRKTALSRIGTVRPVLTFPIPFSFAISFSFVFSFTLSFSFVISFPFSFPFTLSFVVSFSVPLTFVVAFSLVFSFPVAFSLPLVVDPL